MGFFNTASAPTATPATGGGFFNTAKAPTPQVQVQSAKQDALYGQGQVLNANAHFANSIPGLALNTVKGLPQASGIPQAFNSGVQEAEQGASDASHATNPVQETEAGVKELSGGVGAVFSPLAPVLSPINQGVKVASDKISDIPSVQRFAQTGAGKTTARVAQDVGDVSNVLGAAIGGAEGSKVELPKDGFFATAKAPEPTVEAPKTAPEASQSLEQMHSDYMAQNAPKTETSPDTNNPKPATTPEKYNPLTPAESTGETRTSTLASKVDAKAVAEKLSDGLGDLPQYNKVNWEEQGKFASDLVNSDPEKAIRIAMVQEAPPAHVLFSAVFKAVEDYATKTGDAELIHDLGTKSGASLQATRFGQEIGYLSQRDDLSPIKHIQDVQKARSGKANPVKIKAEVAAINDSIKTARSPKETWAKFADSITCNS